MCSRGLLPGLWSAGDRVSGLTEAPQEAGCPGPIAGQGEGPGLEVERRDGGPGVGRQAARPPHTHSLRELLPASSPEGVKEKDLLGCVLTGVEGLVPLKQIEDTTQLDRIRPSFLGWVLNLCPVGTEGRITPCRGTWPVPGGIFSFPDLHPVHPLGPQSTHPAVVIRSVSRHCHVSPGGQSRPG